MKEKIESNTKNEGLSLLCIACAVELQQLKLTLGPLAPSLPNPGPSAVLARSPSSVSRIRSPTESPRHGEEHEKRSLFFFFQIKSRKARVLSCLVFSLRWGVHCPPKGSGKGSAGSFFLRCCCVLSNERVTWASLTEPGSASHHFPWLIDMAFGNHPWWSSSFNFLLFNTATGPLASFYWVVFLFLFFKIINKRNTTLKSVENLHL